MMNSKLKKIMAIILCFALILPITSCSADDFFDMRSGAGSVSNNKHKDNDDDRDRDRDRDDDDDDETTTSETTTDATSQTTTVASSGLVSFEDSVVMGDNGLTYPSYVASPEEIHILRAPGTITGEEAVQELYDIEMDLLSESLTSYADLIILFDDPEAFGFEVDDISWGDVDFSIETCEEDLEDAGEYLERLYALDYESFDFDDRVFYEKIVYDLEESYYANHFTSFIFMESTLNSLTGPQSSFLFLLDVIKVRNNEEAENYLALLEDIDRYYDRLVDYEIARADYGYTLADETYEDMAASFDALVAVEDGCFLFESFANKVNLLTDIDDSTKQSLIERHDEIMHSVVFPEFAECAERLRGLKGNGGVDLALCDIEGGMAYFAWMSRIETNSSTSIEDGFAYAGDYIDGLMTGLYTVVATFTSDESSEYYSHNYTMGTTEENLEYLEEAIAEDFPPLVPHSYQTSEVPAALADNFSPAAYLGYGLDTYDSNLIITNNAEEMRDLAITLAHEGYPGHMYQSIYTRSHTNHPYMYLCDSIGYNEGWTTYIEKYCMKYFASTDTLASVVGAEGSLNVLLYAYFDYGIHSMGWDATDICSEMEGFGLSLPEENAQSIYNVIIQDPGYGIKYGMGLFYTTRIMTNLHESFPDATDYQVFECYLNSLTGTYEQIEVNAYALLEEEMGG